MFVTARELSSAVGATLFQAVNLTGRQPCARHGYASWTPLNCNQLDDLILLCFESFEAVQIPAREVGDPLFLR